MRMSQYIKCESPKKHLILIIQYIFSQIKIFISTFYPFDVEKHSPLLSKTNKKSGCDFDFALFGCFFKHFGENLIYVLNANKSDVT